jgi:hypothetical protein
MDRVTLWLASRPRLAAILAFVIVLVVAACKSDGSSGY